MLTIFKNLNIILLLLNTIYVLSICEINNNFNTENEIVDLPDLGKIQGSKIKTAWTDQTIYSFLGVPYAEAPSGKLRFKPPVPRKAWKNTTLQATKHRNPCPSKYFPHKHAFENDLEDCLNIAVYTKNLNANYSVMVYIHGGGFYTGSAFDHPPRYLLEKNIVLVVPQYRLGVLGFTSTMTDDIPGNVAILDVILALQWVQKYIKYFGGNPDEVTVFGQSAGATIINVLAYSPIVPDNLIKRQITQSGSFLPSWTYSSNQLESAEKICMQLNCSNCRDVNILNTCLMSASVEELLNVNNVSFSFTIGGKSNVLPTIPGEIVKNSKKSYPMMTGVTKHEGSFVVAVFYDLLIQNNVDLTKISSDDIIDRLITLCNRGNDETGLLNNVLKRLLFTNKQLAQKNFTDLIPGLVDLSSILVIKSPTFSLAQLNAKLNPQSTTYLYSFDYQGCYTSFGYGLNTSHYPFNGGVHHSDDNIYLFPKYDLNEEDTKISKMMVEIWTSFAITGIPKSNEITDWKPLNSETGLGPYLHINAKPCYGDNFLDEYLVTVNDPNNPIIRT